jgi:hypothetical protein
MAPARFSLQMSRRHDGNVWTLNIVKTIQGNVKPDWYAEQQKSSREDTSAHEVIPGKECQHKEDGASPDNF